MIERHHVETLLKANGVPPTAPDEVIRSVLISARWDNDDVDTALMVLKENTKTNETHVDTLHKVFHTDDHLSPADISNLLGVKISLDGHDIENSASKRRRFERTQNFSVIILALSIVLLGLTYAMYVEQAGFFFRQ